MRARKMGLLDGIFDGFSNKISYYTGIVLILCGLLKSTKRLILGLGIIFLIFGNTKTKMDKKLEDLSYNIISFFAWLSIQLRYLYL